MFKYMVSMLIASFIFAVGNAHAGDSQYDPIRLAQILDPRNPHWIKLLVMNLIINHQYAEADQEITQSNIRNIELSQVQSMLDMQKRVGAQFLPSI